MKALCFIPATFDFPDKISLTLNISSLAQSQSRADVMFQHSCLAILTYLVTLIDSLSVFLCLLLM